MNRYFVRGRIENVSYCFESSDDIKDLWKQGVKLIKDGRRYHYKCRFIAMDCNTGERLFYLYARLSHTGEWIAKLNRCGKYGRNLYF